MEDGERLAIANMDQFIVDANAQWFIREPKSDYGDNLFAFKVYRGGDFFVVQMPGLPLEKVRYLGAPGQKTFNFPRLYVDGGSWLWSFAIQIATREL